MKRLLAVSLFALNVSAPAMAADLDREVGLIVSGVVDKWAGIQVIDADSFGDETVFATGTEGLLSIPLGDNLSIQNDAKVEYNDQAFDDVYSSIGARYWFQGAAHLSWRNPSQGLFGVFGGVGTGSYGFPVGGSSDYHFIGGEAQVYLDNITLYGQGGYVDVDGGQSIVPVGSIAPLAPLANFGVEDAIFARGVVRWFMDNGSRLELETTYMNMDVSGYLFESTDVDVISWGARYDFDFGNMPIFGSMPLFIGYRGTLRDGCSGGYLNGSTDITDHTIMIGTSYSFSGTRIEVDRNGATLDTPDFGNMIGCGGGGVG